MNYSNFSSDELDRRGFIQPENILKYVSEEEIFGLVFGFLPKEYEYVTSPFRVDKNPGCWFERTSSNTGKLRFVDFADDFGKPMDCFDVVKRFFKIPNFYLTLEFVYEKLILTKKELVERNVQIHIKQSTERRSEILFDSRVFDNRDGKFWSRYEISRQNLIDDKVFVINRYRVIKNGSTMSFIVRDIAYAYTNFQTQRKKLYFPLREKRKRFVTNCDKNDIGGLHILPSFGSQLIITKSYKDWRVLTNNGKHAIWFQNEGAIPTTSVLMQIVKNFQNIIVWFDNDQQGINSALKVNDLINAHFPKKSIPLWLPESLKTENITDPSDMIYLKGKPELLKFLYKFT